MIGDLLVWAPICVLVLLITLAITAVACAHLPGLRTWTGCEQPDRADGERAEAPQ